MEKVPADTKLESAKHILSGAILCFMARRWHNAWFDARISLQVISSYLRHAGLIPYLDNLEIVRDEFSNLFDNSRKNMNAIKHAEKLEKINEGVYHADMEDALFFIHITILELMKLGTDLLVEHEIFMGWCRNFRPNGKPFPCPQWAIDCFTGFEGLSLEEQCRLGLEVFLDKGVPPTPSRKRVK